MGAMVESVSFDDLKEMEQRAEQAEQRAEFLEKAIVAFVRATERYDSLVIDMRSSNAARAQACGVVVETQHRLRLIASEVGR